ncbi:MAG: metallophosphoesterase family protein [Anaerolineae bacterium]|nr:metallophosphoesterase family protein [Anaerolineae bacterium]
MTPLIEDMSLDVFPLEQLIALRNILRRRAYRRLTQAFEAARTVFFDDDSRLVFFSDLHRGDNSRSDAFTQNENVFLQALKYYYRRGFTYVEVGDGDELWQNRRLTAVKRAHRRTFDRLHAFAQADRLHLIFGNHDIQGFQRRRMKKDGLVAHEALVLQHANADQRIFVVHGHQVDFKSDAIYLVSRFVTRHVWRHIQNLGMGHVATSIVESRNRGTLRQRVSEWIEAHKQMVICGHTHTPKAAKADALPYFNTGSGVFDGYITGLEIQNGRIALVKWLQVGLDQVERCLLTPPRALPIAA